MISTPYMNNAGSNTSSTSNMRTTVIKKSLKILSWNIQAPSSFEGNKFDNESFQQTIKGHDFACLQEIRRDVHLTGYRSICNTRNDKKSGGVGILVKNSLIKGVELIKNTENSDFLICRLDKEFFNLTEDIFLLNSYVKPANSPSSNNFDNGKETIKIIEEAVNDLRQHGEVMLCGDFNARIGQKSGMINNDSTNFVPVPDDYIPDEFTPRFSQDDVINTYGTLFLNLVKHNQLTILNGRTLGDYLGNYTSIQKSGCSVIDYFAVSKGLKYRINYFKVLQFTEFSDHKPLSTELRCDSFSTKQFKSLKDSYKPAPCRFIFNDENKDSFFEAQNADASNNFIAELQSKIDHLSVDDSTDEISKRENEVKSINEKFTGHVRNMASDCFKQTKPLINSFKSNNPWFKWRERSAKREFRKATDATSNFPSSDFIRENFYFVKGCYKKVIKKSKNEFFSQLNSDIEEGKVLNWQSFKKLKQKKQDKTNFDSYDMDKFESFFNKLYSDDHKTVSNDQKSRFLNEADYINNNSPNHPEDLNSPITTYELNSAIASLKSGKASSIDMISNEIIKCLDRDHRSLLKNIFNICFKNGIYPWNGSVISPLHKKGSKSDPDNYRAIAVSSVIGKLFSTILLERLIKFRSTHCPDPHNQLGFTKKAQTYDHILTMKTITSKYKSLRKPVYAVFIDFKKAFDSVCRQALFLKLAKNGITGNFYNVLRNMYSNSYACIKLSGFLSNKFQTKKGTEQGHPLSPDLFKIFLSDLSPLLEIKNCPILSNVHVSHLLWADDLILLSLDQKSLQFQLDKLSQFCYKWGIEINELKTQVVIFGKKFNNGPIPEFLLNGEALKIVDSYCYLGVTLHQSGNVNVTQTDLKIKATRAFFGLKRVIMRSKLSFKALSTLFDSLIKPIVLYGAPIWAPCSLATKLIIDSFHSNSNSSQNFIKKIGGSLQEKLHLSFLKWALGVHRKASNIGVWGDTGRLPLVYQSIKLSLNYFKRLTSINTATFVSAAFREQKSMNLPWYRKMESLLKIDEIYSLDHVTAYRIIRNIKPTTTKHNHSSDSPTHTRSIKPLKSKKFRVNKIIQNITNNFRQHWKAQKSMSSKLAFYHSIKSEFNREPYLNLVKGFSRRYSTTKLRISAHDFQVEKGRYINLPRDQRICHWCKSNMGHNVIEDEPHVLYECELYSKHRSRLFSNMQKLPDIENNEVQTIHNDIQLNTNNFKSHLMAILSPNYSNYTQQQNDLTTNIHSAESLEFTYPSTAYASFQKRRSYAVNCVCTFIFNCFEERFKSNKTTGKQTTKTRNPNKIVINVIRNP